MQSCIEVVKNVQKSLHVTEEVDVLSHVKEHLDEKDSFLDHEVPKLYAYSTAYST